MFEMPFSRFLSPRHKDATELAPDPSLRKGTRPETSATSRTGRSDVSRYESVRCSTAGPIRGFPKNASRKRPGSNERIQYIAQTQEDDRKSRKVRNNPNHSEEEFESDEAANCAYSSSSSTGYSTGISRKPSNWNEKAPTNSNKKKHPAGKTNEHHDAALKNALDKVTWETMKQSEMIRKIVEEDGHRAIKNKQGFSSFPGRTQLAELEERGYSLADKIGSGSYANVYVAHYMDPITRKKLDLACKLCDRSVAPSDVVKKFLPREIEILTTLNHPYVIQLHSILQQHNKLYIFMRFAENGDLLEWIRTRGVLKEQHARLWFRQLVMGLDYLHSREIVHRDLKCENVLLTKRNNIKIADFGFARFCVDDGKRVLSRTFCGSAAYAAPEVVSASPYNPKIADVWSLGIILFIMLNGTMPFDDKNLKKLLKDQMEKNWSFRRRLKKIISPEAKEIVTKILEPDTIKRMYIDQIQRSSYYKMTEEMKKFKTFRNYCSEFLKNINQLYAEGPVANRRSDNSSEAYSPKIEKGFSPERS